jgi:hypothetical protein
MLVHGEAESPRFRYAKDWKIANYNSIKGVGAGELEEKSFPGKEREGLETLCDCSQRSR